MTLKFLSQKSALTSLAALTVFLPMSACDLANNFTKIDRTTNGEVQDFRDALAPREQPAGDASASASPDSLELQSYVAEESKSLKAMPLVSLSINQSIPLREALFELAKQADFDIELDPRITGSVIFTARNKPLDEVINRLCDISGLRYKIAGSTLRIELDTPYSETYKVDYLSFVRTNSSTVKTDVSVASGSQTGASGGSSFSVDSKAESDFWKELDTNLKQILASNAAPNFLKTNEDPQMALSSATPPAPPVDAAALGATAPQAGEEDPSATVPAPAGIAAVPAGAAGADATAAAAVSSANGEASALADNGAKPAAMGNQPTTPPQPAVLTVQSLPSSMTAGSTNDSNAVQFTPAYSVNKQAGIISVYGNERLQKQVNSYLKELRRSMTSQVLIEAKVLEVDLSDEFATGINWNLLDRVGDFSINGTFSNPGLSPSSLNGVTFGFSGDDISSFVTALSRFGTVHALASPRLTVLNNQAAVLNVAKNQVYFEIKSTRTPSTVTGVPDTVDYDVTAKTVPDGILINVMPSINLDKRMVSMQVRPTVSKIDSYVDDPSLALNGVTAVKSKVPVMNVQEIDSVVNMKDKQMMVMGGLLQDNTTSSQEGVPVAGEVPMLGTLFRNQADKVSKKELVIFLKSTILDDPSDSIHQTDKDLYRLFGQDRRPSQL